MKLPNETGITFVTNKDILHAKWEEFKKVTLNRKYIADKCEELQCKDRSKNKY